MNKRPILLISFIFLFSCSHLEVGKRHQILSTTPQQTPEVETSEQFSGKVVRVADGDIITVRHLGQDEKIRLAGIDCPERKQAFGTRSRQFTSKLVFGNVVTVEVETVDRFGRTVGEVILPDGRSLNQELVRAGYAWWFRQFSDDETLGQLEEEARMFRRGLWAESNPIPPWEFRRLQRSLR
jgi:micrococcal nuclease